MCANVAYYIIHSILKLSFLLLVMAKCGISIDQCRSLVVQTFSFPCLLLSSTNTEYFSQNNHMRKKRYFIVIVLINHFTQQNKQYVESKQSVSCSHGGAASLSSMESERHKASRPTVKQKFSISCPLLPLFPCLTGLTSSLAKLIKGLKVTKEGQLLHKHLPLYSRSASQVVRRCSPIGQVDSLNTQRQVYDSSIHSTQ